MQHIQTVPVGSGGAASITFSAIPATFTDLLLVLSARATDTAGGINVLVSFNGSTSNFTTRRLLGLGDSVLSGTGTNNFFLSATDAGNTANTFSNGQVYIPNYRSSVAKSFSSDAVTENNGTTAYQQITAGLWNDTAAITSITLTPDLSETFVEHSSASLYGILAGSDGIVAVS